MMVIDASVAAKWFIGEPGARAARDLVERDNVLIAPEIAAELHQPVCDCFYLALAEGEEATLVTADRRLIGRLAGSRWEASCRPLVG